MIIFSQLLHYYPYNMYCFLQILAKGGKLTETTEPKRNSIFSVLPWRGSIPPRDKVKVIVTCSPISALHSYLSRVVVTIGENNFERGRNILNPWDMYTGVVACLGGGYRFEFHQDFDRAR